jgi:hypothetical protein
MKQLSVLPPLNVSWLMETDQELSYLKPLYAAIDTGETWVTLDTQYTMWLLTLLIIVCQLQDIKCSSTVSRKDTLKEVIVYNPLKIEVYVHYVVLKIQYLCFRYKSDPWRLCSGLVAVYLCTCTHRHMGARCRHNTEFLTLDLPVYTRCDPKVFRQLL